MRSITTEYSRFIHKYYAGIIFFWLILTVLSYSYSQQSSQAVESEDDYNPPPDVESEIVTSYWTKKADNPDEDGYLFVDWMYNGDHMYSTSWYQKVTHWMPLPDKPK